jgi:hypothetical protein
MGGTASIGAGASTGSGSHRHCITVTTTTRTIITDADRRPIADGHHGIVTTSA